MLVKYNKTTENVFYTSYKHEDKNTEETHMYFVMFFINTHQIKCYIVSGDYVMDLILFIY